MNGSPSARHTADEAPAQFLAHAVLRYADDDGPDRWARARQMLAENPELAGADVYTASACSEHVALQRILEHEPEAVNRPGGPLHWPPLMYLAYARHNPAVSAGDVIATASLLLSAGADPNAGYLDAGSNCPFTVLTGVFGSGEQGTSKQPPHPYADDLARLLLDGGADPNDGQTLYNRMFEPDDSHLEILFSYGLGSGDGGPWHRKFPERTDSPEQMMRAQLAWAVSHHLIERITLLAGRGVDLDGEVGWPATEMLTPVDLANVTGRPDIADLLIQLGASAGPSPEAALVCALLTGDRSAVDGTSPADLDAVRRRRPSLVLRAAVAGSPAGIKLLTANGFDVNHRGRQDLPIEQEWETALHFAAGEGDLGLVELLLERGADATITDRRFGMTPLGWAEYFGRRNIVDLLMERA